MGDYKHRSGGRIPWSVSRTEIRRKHVAVALGSVVLLAVLGGCGAPSQASQPATADQLATEATTASSSTTMPFWCPTGRLTLTFDPVVVDSRRHYIIAGMVTSSMSAPVTITDGVDLLMKEANSQAFVDAANDSMQAKPVLQPGGSTLFRALGTGIALSSPVSVTGHVRAQGLGANRVCEYDWTYQSS